MPHRMLQILTTAYRATLEEQDDPVLWLTHSLRNNGADVDVLLRSSAVNYIVRSQQASGLRIGDWLQSQPPDLAFEVGALMSKDCRVFALADDLAVRGIRRDEVLPGVGFVAKAELPALLRNYKHIWQW
ncbi:MAG TPA: hypothetical protein VFG30_28925 [Polyangiales bacterium]|nr:hypothetical protein [Polyangiales bacterium]